MSQRGRIALIRCGLEAESMPAVAQWTTSYQPMKFQPKSWVPGPAVPLSVPYPKVRLKSETAGQLVPFK